MLGEIGGSSVVAAVSMVVMAQGHAKAGAAAGTPWGMITLWSAGLLVALGLLGLLTLRPVREPNRAVIFRLATLHRVAGPGMVFVLPVVESMVGQVEMGEREMQLALGDLHTADGAPINAALDVTWRLAPQRGRLTASVRRTLLQAEERRAKLVEETVTRAARLVVSAYTREDLRVARARESAALTMAHDANEALYERGLFVERVFWRA